MIRPPWIRPPWIHPSCRGSEPRCLPVHLGRRQAPRGARQPVLVSRARASWRPAWLQVHCPHGCAPGGASCSRAERCVARPHRARGWWARAGHYRRAAPMFAAWRGAAAIGGAPNWSALCPEPRQAPWWPLLGPPLPGHFAWRLPQRAARWTAPARAEAWPHAQAQVRQMRSVQRQWVQSSRLVAAARAPAWSRQSGPQLGVQMGPQQSRRRCRRPRAARLRPQRRPRQ